MAAAVWVATALLPGIDVHGGFVTYLALSLLFGLVNAVVGPLLHLVALPLSVFTVGGSALVVNGVLLALTARLSARLDVAGLGSAVLGSLVISIVTTIIELVVRPIREPGRRSGGRVQLSDGAAGAGHVAGPPSPRLMHRKPRWLVDVSRVWDCRAAGR